MLALHSVQVEAWATAAEKYGTQAVSGEAQHLHLVTVDKLADRLADYMGKVTWEMTSTQTKRGTVKGSRTPWQIFHDAITGDDIETCRQDLALWHQWEAFSHGKRSLTWSRGLRKRVGLDVEATDEDIAAAEIGTREDTVLTILDWRPFASDATLGPALLEAVGKSGDAVAGARWCDAHGVSCIVGAP